MRILQFTSWCRNWLLGFLTIILLPGLAPADSGVPPFDFTDNYYLAHGINPANILGRVDGTPPVSVADDSPDPDRRDVRVLETTGGFDASGKLLYYNIFG